MAVHLAVAADVFDGVLFCAVLFPTNCLGCDLGFLRIFLPTSSFSPVSEGCICNLIDIGSVDFEEKSFENFDRQITSDLYNGQGSNIDLYL